MRAPLPRLHDLRHAYATHLLEAGYNVHVVAELIGDDPRQVWERYGHALPDRIAGAGEALSAFRRARGLDMDSDWTAVAGGVAKDLQTQR